MHRRGAHCFVWKKNIAISLLSTKRMKGILEDILQKKPHFKLEM